MIPDVADESVRSKSLILEIKYRKGMLIIVHSLLFLKRH